MTAHLSDQDIQRDAISGARILVGDMLMWSDLDTLDVPLATREVVRAAIAAKRPRRVLLAGPRAGLLVDAVPTDVPVDLLVRALPDARTLGDRAGLHKSADLYCGGLDVFEPGHTYDLVIALGGPERLLGPDSGGLTDAQAVARLSALLDDGGRFVVDLANELGFTDLVSAVPDEALESDAGWHIGAQGFATRHLFARERAAILEGEGLRLEACFAAMPSVDEHRVLVHDAALADGSLRDQVGFHAGKAMDEHFASTPMLREPRNVVERVVEAGMLDELAPGWLVVATKGAPASTPTYPALVVAEAEAASPWSTVAVIAADASQSVAWADERTDSETSEGTVSRGLSPLAPGRSFELDLRRACATRRHAAIRSRVRQYAAWLADGKVWTTQTAEQRFFATPANTLIDGDRLRLADPSWRRTGVVSADDALVRGLRDFARRLLASGSAHPWRVTVTPDELTITLASMAGLTVTEAMIARVARTEAEVASTVAGRPEDLDELLERNLEQGQFARDLPAPDEIGFRELLTHHRVISRELREKQGQVKWLEGTLRHRDRYIRTLERVIERYEETLTYRAVEAMRAPRRIATEKAVAAAKSTAQDALPPGALSKARQLAARVLK
ncbi:hypothetical protein [Terrabacter terrigena]|uniref:Class I SAM-dependent methyltransferase n=1 Tax=Terrabacter terrigena TaxID=574718 RepID=A0ABW3MYJ8_9MICO